MRTRKRRLGSEDSPIISAQKKISFMEEVNYTMEGEEGETNFQEVGHDMAGEEKRRKEGFKKKLRRYSSINR